MILYANKNACRFHAFKNKNNYECHKEASLNLRRALNVHFFYMQYMDFNKIEYRIKIHDKNKTVLIFINPTRLFLHRAS